MNRIRESGSSPAHVLSVNGSAEPSHRHLLPLPPHPSAPLLFLSNPQPLVVIAIGTSSAVVCFQDTIYRTDTPTCLTAPWHMAVPASKAETRSDVETHLLPSLGALSYDAPSITPRTFFQSFPPQLFTRPGRFIGPPSLMSLYSIRISPAFPFKYTRVLGSSLNFLRSPAPSTPQRALSSLLPVSPQSFRPLNAHNSCSLVFKPNIISSTLPHI